jgi:hypothetical protein
LRAPLCAKIARGQRGAQSQGKTNTKPPQGRTR